MKDNKHHIPLPLMNIIKRLNLNDQKEEKVVDDKAIKVNTVEYLPITNVVSVEKLKKVQQSTLHALKDYVSCTYGPMGSYTEIISGTNTGDKSDTIGATYSKDGLKVLKNIRFGAPIEQSIQDEVRNICSYVEKVVGDGTTSAVVLSSLIYDELLHIMEKHKISPRRLVRIFDEVVKEIQDKILQAAKPLTLDQVYDIAMVSTNGNATVAAQIRTLYKDYGMGVEINVEASNDEHSKIKEYKGLTLDEGYSDPAYINTLPAGTCEIHNAHVYCFKDPIDTPQMVQFFEQIITKNIIEPCSSAGTGQPVPTVIMGPTLSRDGSGVLVNLVNALYRYDTNKTTNRKPPIVVITNYMGTGEGIALDIARLCGCRMIRKYLDPDMEKKDQEKGTAPTMENIQDFYGEAELVVADSAKTSFINPKWMTEGDTDNDVYRALVNFLEAEIKNATDNNEDALTIGRLKKRLRSLKGNMIDFYVGGISAADRDSLKDLVEDACENCASAAVHGYGRAANFEGLMAAIDVWGTGTESDVENEVKIAIVKAYVEAVRILYSSALSDEDTTDALAKSVAKEIPLDVSAVTECGLEEYVWDRGERIICSIMTDVEILNAISKIITLMVTSNQCLLNDTILNRY